MKAEIAAAKGLGTAGVCGLCTLNLLFLTGVFLLARVLPDWGASLIVAAGVLLVGTVAGLVGWSKRVRTPLEKTQRTLKENAQWTKERIV